MDDWNRNGGGWNDADWGRMHDGLGWGGWLAMALLMLLLAALVIGLVVWLLVRSTSGGRPTGPETGSFDERSTPEQVLGERFARGEIDEDEYLRRRSVLRGG